MYSYTEKKTCKSDEPIKKHVECRMIDSRYLLITAESKANTAQNEFYVFRIILQYLIQLPFELQTKRITIQNHVG